MGRRRAGRRVRVKNVRIGEGEKNPYLPWRLKRARPIERREEHYEADSGSDSGHKRRSGSNLTLFQGKNGTGRHAWKRIGREDWETGQGAGKNWKKICTSE